MDAPFEFSAPGTKQQNDVVERALATHYMVEHEQC